MDSLDECDIDDLLVNTGYGFLALARSNHPYVIPMSFGYDGDRLYFQMNSQGRKFEYTEDNPTAAFGILDIDRETGTSRSVLVEGRLSEVREEDRTPAFEALAANAEFGTDLEVWGAPIQETDLTLFELRPTTVTGRVFGEN